MVLPLLMSLGLPALAASGSVPFLATLGGSLAQQVLLVWVLVLGRLFKRVISVMASRLVLHRLLVASSLVA